jgi:hypothetical protein
MTAGGRWYLTLTTVPSYPLYWWDPVRWSTQRQLLQISTGTYVLETELAWHFIFSVIFIVQYIISKYAGIRGLARSHEKTVWKIYGLPAFHISS